MFAESGWKSNKKTKPKIFVRLFAPKAKRVKNQAITSIIMGILVSHKARSKKSVHKRTLKMLWRVFLFFR